MPYGDVLIFEDINTQVVNIKVYSSQVVNCNEVNTFHYKLVNVGCNSVKMAPLVAGKPISGNICYYELQCNPGDVICTVELRVEAGSVPFSIFELMIN